MKRFLMLSLLIPTFSFCQAYAVSTIPDSLLQNVDVVKRYEEKRLIIKSPSKALLKHKVVYTILNEKGNWAAWYYNYYDKFHDLSDISGVLYDATGKEIKSIRKKDIVDASEDDGFSLMTDARHKRFNLIYSTYPYTVEFEDEIEYRGYFSLSNWSPIGFRKMSVLQTNFIVECHDGYKIRYKVKNFVAPTIANEKNITILKWQATNLKPLEYEPYQPQFTEVAPYVFIAPTDFEIEGYKGSINSWKDYGLFFKELNKDRDVLPQTIKEDVQKITATVSSKKEKITAVYNYLQQNTRYISVQLGIGGWQPFKAEYVAQKKYGDCKALSNYMVAMLKEAGIKAYHVLIAAGENQTKRVVEDFPDNYFNHMIACVPLEKDTMWLECTNQIVSAGYSGDFTGNRKALLIADDGGYLVNTPHYKPTDNLQLRNIKATIDENGNLVCNIETKFTGQQQENAHDIMHEMTAKQKEDYLNKYIPLANYKIEKSSYIQTKATIPIVVETLQINAPNYATISGKRMFVIPNLVNKQNTKLETEKPRQYDIEYDHNFIDADTVLITIPQGYSIESMPKNVNITNKFGEYKAICNFEGNTIKYTRYYMRFSQRYPPSDYLELAKFYDDMAKADRAKMVFVKKEG
jgi:hypothetical protein